MAKSKPLNVVATANGYYGSKVRIPGERFRLDDEADFSKVWMERADKEPEAERFVATGGTDGVVGTTVKVTDPADRTAREQKDLAMAGVSDNDDRSRDKASARADDTPVEPKSGK